MSVLKGKTKRKKMHKTVQICAQNEDAEVCEDVDRINFLREENLGGGRTHRATAGGYVCI